MKLFSALSILLFVSPVAASECAVFEVYRASFTPTQVTVFLTYMDEHSQSDEPPLKFRLEYYDAYKFVISVNAKIRELQTVQENEAIGKIRYIGSYSFDQDGYKRDSAYHALQKYLADLFTVKCSTCGQ